MTWRVVDQIRYVDYILVVLYLRVFDPNTIVTIANHNEVYLMLCLLSKLYRLFIQPSLIL